MTSTDSARRKRAAMSSRGAQGRYKDPSPWKVPNPYCIYFYYAKKIGRGKYDVRVYVSSSNSEISMTRLKTKIESLTRNARRNGNNPSASGWSFNDIEWRRYSWLVIAMDNNNFENGDAVDIQWIDDTMTKPKYGPNHCFFDGGDGVMQISTGDPISVLWMKNHMRNQAGDVLVKGDQQKFKFKFNPSRRIRDYPDESGTNTGPVIGPP